jgi:hypothetical protein
MAAAVAASVILPPCPHLVRRRRSSSCRSSPSSVPGPGLSRRTRSRSQQTPRSAHWTASCGLWTRCGEGRGKREKGDESPRRRVTAQAAPTALGRDCPRCPRSPPLAPHPSTSTAQPRRRWNRLPGLDLRSLGVSLPHVIRLGHLAPSTRWNRGSAEWVQRSANVWLRP